MAILEEEVWVTVGVQTDVHYKDRGYEIPKNEKGKTPRGTKIKVKIEDVPLRSTSVKLTKVCDICGIHIKNQTYDNIIRKRQSNKEGIDYCKTCANKKGLNKRDEIFLEKNKHKTIWFTNPEIAKMLENPELGKKLFPKSSKRSNFICPDCGFLIKNKRIGSVFYFGLSCPRCSDGISYPEKFTFNVLSQLNIEFEYQKVFNWAHDKRYDFYIPSSHCIIETHGGQHYENGVSFESYGGRSFEGEQLNDIQKENLAIHNNIDNYIKINCSKSEMEFIKDSILSSYLNELFDLEIVDWLQCHKHACRSLVKRACDLWNEHKDTIIISKVLKLSSTTITSYLKKGKKLNWCDYEPKENHRFQVGRKNTKEVVCLSKGGKFIKHYFSIREASKDTGIAANHISSNCNKKCKSAGGFMWVFKKEYGELKKDEIKMHKEDYDKLHT